MKILVINGSPKGKGNTHKIVQIFESKLKEFTDVEFEYVFLKELNLGLCKGCFTCITKGETKCPLKDSARDLLENKISASDGVIFASSIYVANVSWLMKNFYDRIAYLSHRPKFFKQGAIVVGTAAGFGLRDGLNCLSNLPNVIGFRFVQKLGIKTPPYINFSKLDKKTINKIHRKATKFHSSLKIKEKRKVSFGQLVLYNIFKKMIPIMKSFMLADFEYWNHHNWFTKQAKYFVETRLNPIKVIFARFIGKMAGRSMKKELKSMNQPPL